MKKARRPVSTVRDYRPPPTAKASAPLERRQARPGAVAWGKSTIERDPLAALHDNAARALPKQVLIAAAEDLHRRSLPARPDWKTEEGREAGWSLGRRAALFREIARRGLTQADRMP